MAKELTQTQGLAVSMIISGVIILGVGIYGYRQEKAAEENYRQQYLNQNRSNTNTFVATPTPTPRKKKKK